MPDGFLLKDNKTVYILAGRIICVLFFVNDLDEYILDYYKMSCLGNTPHRQGRPPIATIVQTPKSYFCASSSKKWQTSGYHRTGPRHHISITIPISFQT